MSCAVCHKVCGPLKGETHSWRCAGVLAGQRKTLHRLHAITEATAAEYDSPGKRKARDLVIAVAAKDCRTFLDLWGGGQSARAAVAAGLEVTSAEKVRSLFAAMKLDAKEHGYSVWPKSIGRIKGVFDFVFADFCGGASPPTRRELRKIVPHVGKWLALTLAPDHQLDQALTGPSGLATVPVWAVEATEMSLVYAARYVRNERGQTMWLLLLTARDASLRGNQQLAPLTIARELQTRRYWATPDFRLQFPSLVAHRSHSETERQRQRMKEVYVANRDKRREQSREWHRANRDAIRARARARAEEDPENYRENQREYQRRYRERNAERIKARNETNREKRIAYRRAWYLDHRDEQIENARKWRQAHHVERPPKTHCPNGHPYSGDNLGMDSQGYKQCRTCRYEQDRERRLRRRQSRLIPTARG